MKLAKRSLALLVCAVMLVSSCIFVNAETASVDISQTNGHNVTDNGEVVWTQYDVTGGNTGHTEEVNILEFNPADGYIPMAFVSSAGWVSKMSKQYEVATNKYGYEVAGGINGSFFGVANGTLSGILISNGRIQCAHNGSFDVVAFDSEGKMTTCTSYLDYKVYINGREFSNAIRYVNKRYDVDGYATGQFYYYDTSCGNIADSAESGEGYQIICKKLYNTDLTVGGTLLAEVIEVKENEDPATFGDQGVLSDNFVLYCSADSSYVPYVKNLVAGDSIAITVSETIAGSKDIMENANSVITNVGWLVKDGVDMTETQATIGSHNVNTTMARWTAFGTKPDGTYVFLTSDGAATGTAGRSLSLREIAATMMDLGCDNVIRMDGGGSSAMYSTNVDGEGTDGYFYRSEDRSVADCILIVKKSSAVDGDLVTALNEAIADAKATVEATPNETLSAYIAEAEALVAAGDVVASDARAMIAKLSGKGALREAISNASTVIYQDYSEKDLIAIREAYAEAVDVFFDTEATVSDIETACKKLENALDKSAVTLLSLGKSYTTTAPDRNDTWDDDGIRLTDGSKSNGDAGTSAYSGWNCPVEVTVDLGEVMDSSVYTAYAAKYSSWGIAAPSGVEVMLSSDGESFESVGTATGKEIGSGESGAVLYSYSITLDEAKSARYVKFVFTRVGSHTWIDEVEVALANPDTDEPVSDVITFNGFNGFIWDSYCYIYTPDYGTLTASGINHKYTTNVILEATEDPDIWTIVSVKKNVGTAADVNLEENQIMIACHKGASAQSHISEAMFLAAKPGYKVRFFGIDIANKSMGIAPYARVIEPEYKLGDINSDGEIDKFDYILVKRSCMKTYTLDEVQLKAADINGDGEVDKFDYILIKRHCMKTYVIEG